MNIFYTDKDPHISAISLGNKHVVKMIVESAQMLSSAHRILDNNQDINLYKATHINHPSSKWVRDNKQHYIWLYDHFIGLLNEYTHRYEKIHSSSRLILLLKNTPKNISDKEFSEPPCAMPDEYKISNSSEENYKEYYNKSKIKLHQYKNRNRPFWLIS